MSTETLLPTVYLFLAPVSFNAPCEACFAFCILSEFFYYTQLNLYPTLGTQANPSRHPQPSPSTLPCPSSPGSLCCSQILHINSLVLLWTSEMLVLVCSFPVSSNLHSICTVRWSSSTKACALTWKHKYLWGENCRFITNLLNT